VAKVQNPFQDRFSQWAERVERSLIRFVILLSIVVVVSQGLLSHEKLRLFLSYPDQLEGTAFKEEAKTAFSPAASEKPAGEKQSREGLLAITCVTGPRYPQVKILINGKVAGDLGRGSIALPVREGDLVEIDGTGYQAVLTFRLTGVSDNISEPRVGTEVVTHQSIERLGRVTLRKP